TGGLGSAAIYLANGSTGAIRTTILALGIVAGSSTGNSERTVYNASVSGGAFTATQGDYIVIELGQSMQNTSSGSQNPTNAKVYTSGTTTISSDNASVASAKSFVTAPFSLIFIVGFDQEEPWIAQTQAVPWAPVPFRDDEVTGANLPNFALVHDEPVVT